jgi:hypothetical protein
MIRTWKNIGLYGTVGLLHPDTHFGGDREKILHCEAYLRLRIHGDFVNAGQRFFPPRRDRAGSVTRRAETGPCLVTRYQVSA